MKSIAMELERIFGVAVITCIIIPGFITLAQRTQSALFMCIFIGMGLLAFLINLVLLGFIRISRQKQ